MTCSNAIAIIVMGLLFIRCDTINTQVMVESGQKLEWNY
ncbi:uncharacterized protein METZ01_LOCUS483840 [marine metagenome]|uniref:Uncharacterized protein n=1 Tax=marine metagenome TaxID=408172 RepID=A0A383CF06_9ZZZZ